MKLHTEGLLALAVFVSSGTALAAHPDDDDVVVAAKPEPPPKVVPPPHDPSWLERVLEAFTVVTFVQGDIHGSQASQDELQQGGALLNQDRFVIKTARARLTANWANVGAEIQLEANTVNGPIVRPYHLFGTLRIPNPKGYKLPLAAASLGLMDTPYGYEAPESPRTRWFMDRSTSSKAFFPGVPDLGLWIYGALGPFHWSFAAMNGDPLDSVYQGLAPVSAKQVVMRLGFDGHPRKDLDISGEVSSLRGLGFHPGAQGGKNQIIWNDYNEDGLIQPIELVGEPATAAIPSKSFDRWAIGADLQVRLRTRLGATTLSGEITIADNLDRGLYIADPVFLGHDTREIGGYAAITQEIMKWGVVGFRFDYYDPNLDGFDKRSGQLVPSDQSITTYSPLVGFVFPGVTYEKDGRAYGKARLLFQYDFIRNHFGRAPNGLPTNLAMDAWTVRLQVEL